MRILLAPDSYKGSLSATDVAQAMARGFLAVDPDAQIDIAPIADGGEGTVESFISASGGRQVTARVCGPLGEAVDAAYGLSADGRTAVIEMAQAAGLTMVPEGARNPLNTTTYGVGELIAHAAAAGATSLIIGLGGSATNDGGMGMAQALGARFFDAAGTRIAERSGRAMLRAVRADLSGVDPALAALDVRLACDVKNPLCGPDGASAVFGPQKGADAAMMRLLDDGLAVFARAMEMCVGRPLATIPGSGAAGGLAMGLMALFNATPTSGIELLIEAAGIDARIGRADIVVTGEGRTDAQTAWGKAPAGIAAHAARYQKPVICLSGALGDGYQALYERGFSAILSISDGPGTLDTAMARTESLLFEACRALGTLAGALRKSK